MRRAASGAGAAGRSHSICIVFSISREKFLPLLEQWPEYIEHFMRAANSRRQKVGALCPTHPARSLA